MRFRTGASALNCVPVRRRWRWLGSLGALSSKRKFLSLRMSQRLGTDGHRILLDQEEVLMKRLISLLAITILFFTGPVLAAQKGEPYTPEKVNPQKDPDVQRGYEEHQKGIKEQRERERRREKGEIEEPYKVHPSGPTAR